MAVSPLRAAALLAALVLIDPTDAAPAGAQADGDPVTIGTYRVIESAVLGETRRLLVHLPRGYADTQFSYPVVYHSYGDYLSQYYADAYSAVEQLSGEGRMPQAILVGIDNIDRYRYLRPLGRDGSPTGIANYIRFLTEEVFPFVERDYRAADFRIFVGPQAGAIFGLYVLQTNPDLFDAFILNNPFGDEANARLLLDQAASFYEASPALRKWIFITYGGIRDTPGAIGGVERYAQLAAPAAAKGFALQLENLGANDDFIPPLPIKGNLRALFGEYCVSDYSRFGGLADILSFYGHLSEHYGFAVPPSETALIRTAGTLRGRGDADQAWTLLDALTDFYPASVDGYWQKAELASERGDDAAAIALYRRCIEINPSMANFAKRRIAALSQD